MEILHNLSNYITNDVLYLILFISVLILTWNIISYFFVLHGKCNCVECTDEEVNSCFDYNQTEELHHLNIITICLAMMNEMKLLNIQDLKCNRWLIKEEKKP